MRAPGLTGPKYPYMNGMSTPMRKVSISSCMTLYPGCCILWWMAAPVTSTDAAQAKQQEAQQQALLQGISMRRCCQLTFHEEVEGQLQHGLTIDPLPLCCQDDGIRPPLLGPSVLGVLHEAAVPCPDGQQVDNLLARQGSLHNTLGHSCCVKHAHHGNRSMMQGVCTPCGPPSR